MADEARKPARGSIYLLLAPLSLLILWSSILLPAKPCHQTFLSTYSPSFPLHPLRHQIEHLPSHSWEYGIASQALLDYLHPSLSPFSHHSNTSGHWRLGEYPSWRTPDALIYAREHITTPLTSSRSTTLFPAVDGDDAVADPASLGIPTILLGRYSAAHREAAGRQVETLLGKGVRRGRNGALSHRRERVEFWSDFVAMVPPFLVAWGVQKGDREVIGEGIRQIELYRDVLRIQEGASRGLWKHTVVENGATGEGDDGAWSTGVGWVLWGMVRCRALIAGVDGVRAEVDQLDAWIEEILQTVVRLDDDDSGLLRNYLGDDGWFGETSGTSLIAATAYRMAVIHSERFGNYLDWADTKRKIVFSHISRRGQIGPAVNPLQHDSRTPIDNSPEGASFALILLTSWRDCHCSTSSSRRA